MSFRSALIVYATAMLGLASSARAQYVGHVSTYVMDARTGTTFSEEDADLQRYPASLTKMMTLYLTFQALERGQIRLHQSMPVSIHSSMQEPSKLGLRPGSYLTVEQAILALVTKSANDAACTLGEFLGGGSETRFAERMTLKARQLGMSNTTFRNASGLPDPDQITTARDMARLARHIIVDFPQYYHYFGVDRFSFHHRLIKGHDPMLKLYAGADGLKTGYTELAGHNLVSSAWQGKTRLIGVVLGAPSNQSRNETMISLLNEGFVANGQIPLPPLKMQPVMIAHRAVPRKRVLHRHMRRDVMLVSYHPSGKVHKGRKRMVHHTAVSHRGHHRS